MQRTCGHLLAEVTGLRRQKNGGDRQQVPTRLRRSPASTAPPGTKGRRWLPSPGRGSRYGSEPHVIALRPVTTWNAISGADEEEQLGHRRGEAGGGEIVVPQQHDVEHDIRHQCRRADRQQQLLSSGRPASTPSTPSSRRPAPVQRQPAKGVHARERALEIAAAIQQRHQVGREHDTGDQCRTRRHPTRFRKRFAPDLQRRRDRGRRLPSAPAPSAPSTATAAEAAD